MNDEYRKTKTELPSHMIRFFAILKMFRPLNLVIMALTMALIRIGIIGPFLYNRNAEFMTPPSDFLVLVAVTLLVAMGGYVINDYFDVTADDRNRPGKNAVGIHLNPRTAMNLYLILTGLGIAFGFFLAYRFNSLTFGLIIPFIAGLLWFYSERYKKMLLRGNLIVSFLSALVILLVGYTEFLHLRQNPEVFSDVILNMDDAVRLTLFYALFAFICTLIREIIKDAEDVEGDREQGCRTLPIVTGLAKTKWITAGVTIAMMVILGYAQSVFLNRGYSLVFWYLLTTVQLPLAYLLYSMRSASMKEDFHFLSLLCKLVMVAGILSIQLISFTL